MHLQSYDLVQLCRIAESWITLIRRVFVEGDLTALDMPGASSFLPLEVSHHESVYVCVRVHVLFLLK